MKKQKDVKGVLYANNLTQYQDYKIEYGSVSGDTNYIFYTNTVSGGTFQVSFDPTGITELTITADITGLTWNSGETNTYSLTVLDVDSNDITSNCTYTSSDLTVASVSASGEISQNPIATTGETCTITISYNDTVIDGLVLDTTVLVTIS